MLRNLLPLLVLLAAVGCGPRGGPEIWRFAIEEPRGSVQDAYAQRFRTLIEEKSAGQVEVKVYPYGTLGTSDQMTELLHDGSLQFAMASPGHLGTLIPEIQVLLLHFVFSDEEDVNRRVLTEDEELHGAFDALYARKGFKLLSIYPEGWQVWTTRVPVRRPEDFAGMKFRVMTSPLLLAAYQAYGASATPLPYGEVYGALQLRMIDGQVNPIFAIQEMSFYEVTDYLIFARQAQFFTTAAANRPFYEDLPPERRAWIDETVEELETYIFDTQRAYNEERLQLILQRKPSMNVVHLTEDERERFRQASLPVREEYLRLAGPRGRDLLDQVLRSIERAEREAGG